MRGRLIPLSAPRTFVGDLIHFAVPSVPVQREMHIPDVADARGRGIPRVPWPAVFLKAYARVAAGMPELRRAYVNWPWPRLVEYPRSVASITIERDYRGDPGVFVGKIKSPDGKSLAEVAARIRHFVEAPVEDVTTFRRQLHVSRLPRPARRLGWRLALNAPRLRGAVFGTFGLSTYSALGAESLHPLSPLTTTLNYGVISASGTVRVRLIYDHRVLDGATVARALAALEVELNTVILTELRGGPPLRLAG